MQWDAVVTGLVGVILGAAGDRAFISFNRRSQRQSQQAGDNASQTQVGRDYVRPSEDETDKRGKK